MTDALPADPSGEPAGPGDHGSAENTEAWEHALAAFADLLDRAEAAVDDEAPTEWLPAPQGAPTRPLGSPTPAQAERASRMLAEAERLASLGQQRCDAMAAELSSGDDRRRAASRYGASERLGARRRA